MFYDHFSARSLLAKLGRSKAMEEANVNRDDEFGSLQKTVQVFQAKLARNEMAMNQMAGDIESMKSRSMRDNIIINFDPSVDDYKESDGEDCSELAAAFMHNVMGVTSTIYIQAAHRLGRHVHM